MFRLTYRYQSHSGFDNQRINTMLDLAIATGLDLSNVDAINAKAASLATNANDKVVNTMLASLAYAVGAHGKTIKANAMPSFVPAFAAFAGVHYGPNTGRKLSEKSAVAYRSTFGAYTMAGYHPGYDAAPVAEFGLKLKGAFTKRGAVIRAILAAHPTTVPTEAQMLACVPKEKADTARSTAEDARDDMIAAFGDGGTFAAILASNPKADVAAADVIAALQALAVALPEQAEEGEEIDYAKRAAEKRAALVAATKKPKK